MKEIPIAGGKIVLVDDADYDVLASFKWYLSSTGYATRTHWFGRQFKPKKKHVWMHRQLCPITKDQPLVDHKNGNKLDNRRANLRASTKSQNGSNRGRTRINQTGFKGVSKHTSGFISQIRVHNRNHYLGWYSSPEPAAMIYNLIAVEVFGEFANLN